MMLHIVSDLHILSPEDPIYQTLLSILTQKASPGDVVVMAGDIFDLFVGNKSIFKKKYDAFYQALSGAAQRGVELHYIEGNHDFLMKKTFASLPNLNFHPHDVQLQLDGKRFFIAHGDTVDPTDYGYRFLRFFFRSFFIRLVVRCIPGSWIEKIGNKSSKYSRQTSQWLPHQLPIKRMEYMRKVYRNYAAERLAEGYDYVVLGHCHDLDEMEFQIGGRLGQYVNVGFPPVHGSYLTWSPGDKKIQRERLF